MIFMQFLEVLEEAGGGNWRLPVFFGSCGRLVVVSNDGEPLNNLYHLKWQDRADLALQVLEIVDTFTVSLVCCHALTSNSLLSACTRNLIHI